MRTISSSLILTAAALIAMQPSSQAALLVYEGFSYGATDKPMDGVTSTATGLGAGVEAWSVQRTGGAAASTNVNYLATGGLTFSNIATSGGGLRMSATFSTTDAQIAASVKLSTGAQTGTIWSTYLANYSTISLGNGGSMGQGYANGTGTAAALNFRAGQSSDASATSRKLTVAYDTGSAVSGNLSIATGTTYLFITKLTNVGLTLGASPNNGVASTWMLTQAQYDAWDKTEATLNAATTFRLTDSVISGQYLFDSNGYVQFRADSPGFNSFQEVGVLDELRYGTSLNDVIPVPEPSTATVFAMGLAGLLLTSRRRKSVA